MTSSQKFSVSLLISVVIFAFFSVITLSGQFDSIEAKFYQPAVRKPIEQKIRELSEQEKQYNQILFERFASFASDDAVLSFTKSVSSDEEVKSRALACAKIFSSSPYLHGIRIVDSNGRKIHYSSFESDKKKQNERSTVYEDYSNFVKNGQEVEFELLDCKNGRKFKIFNDFEKKRIIYSLPFIGKDNSGKISQQADVFFYCGTEDFLRFLYSKNKISLSEKDGAEYLFTGNSDCAGYIFGLPYSNSELLGNGLEALRENVRKKVLNLAENRRTELFEQNIGLTGTYLLLDKTEDSSEQIDSEKKEFSTENAEENKEPLSASYNFAVFTKIVDLGEENFSFLCFVYDGGMFKISLELRILLLSLVFLTLFLTIFLILNLKRDDLSVIKARINRFQKIFAESYENSKEKLSGEELKKRKNELKEEIKKSLGRRGKKYPAEIDALFENGWAEFFETTIFSDFTKNSQLQERVKIDSTELKNVLEEILGSGQLSINVKNQKNAKKRDVQKSSDEVEPVEEVESVDDVEPVDEAESTDEIEPVDEIESAGEIEPVDEIESADDVELVEEVESVEDIEPVEEAESVDDVEKVDEAENVDDVETVDEIESVDDVEPVDETESVDEIEPVDEIESVDDVEPVDEAESVEDIEPVEEAESVDDVETVEEVESADEIEPVDEIESVDEIEPVDEIESVDEIEPVDEAESVDDVEPVEEAESVDDIEPVEEAESVDEIETVDEAENVDDVEAVDEIESVDDVETVEEVESADEIEPVDEIESVDDVETVEEVESADEIEPVDEIESVDEIEPVDEAESIGETENEDDTEIQFADGEKLDFSSPKPKNLDSDEDFEFAEDFKVGKIDFSFLDEDEDNSEEEQKMQIPEDEIVEQKEKTDFIETSEDSQDLPETEKVEELEEVEELDTLETLSDQEATRPFMFAGFAQSKDYITDLTSISSKAIVESEDGTFHIEGEPEKTDYVLDRNLEELVESVIWKK
ncbi:MAG: DUF4573 domain-containing protein [Treponema sp.]|uniref:DUF4573 domain-containing protein n=1 Tax=Treponema sp. TaxID=166 RepID=UPI00257DE9A6|nr:DUF4573 domain-containing protein [Treponema sp.]MBQ9101750.1 DUF4573 domain-containing protein [Treponema sp.]